MDKNDFNLKVNLIPIKNFLLIEMMKARICRMKPMIGIAGNSLTKHASVFHDNFVTYTPQGFVDGVKKAEGIPIIFPVGDPAEAKEYMAKVDGLLLAGGQDISPHLYGEEPSIKLEETAPKRDVFELALIKEAFKQKKPILAVCRGMQLLNVAQGGNLYQDLSAYPEWTVQHLQASHPEIGIHTVTINEQSHLGQLMGSNYSVNSYHHQAVKTLAADFVATAWSPDGLVEAFEAKDQDQSVVAVQWHPELMQETDPVMQRLFTDLIQRSTTK